MNLHSYQTAAVDNFLNAIGAGKRRLILVCPTGGGKTVIASDIIRRITETEGHVLVLAHRREIVGQTSQKLDRFGVDHGIIQAGEPTDESARVQVASLQTLYTRAIRGSKMELPPADLIVVDEAHHATAKSWHKIIEAYPDAALLGLTATPCRGDGRGLGSIFAAMIGCPQVEELIKLGVLVPTKVYAPTLPDLRGVETRLGDYVKDQLADAMDKPRLIGDIVTHWHRLAEGRKTVIFASGVQHSIHIRDEFRKSGVSCDHIDGSTPKDERDEILKKLEVGAIDIVTNCGVLTEGWDLPDIGCEVLARPTRSLGLYLQMVGRAIRSAPGKVDAIIIDHSGATHRHGFAEDPVVWTLDTDTRAENERHKTRSESDISSRLVDCSQCGA